MKKICNRIKKYAYIFSGKGKPSLKAIRAAKGSVTIFLLVIMLPMLVFSFTVMDLSRIFLANDAIEAATDIALRSAMPSYDDILKDMYGIIATSQSDKELEERVTKYYISTLCSSGIKVDEGATSEFIKSIFDTGFSKELNDNDNLLKVFSGGTVNGKEYDGLTIEGVKDSAASNPDVLHRQIVEYMKYRGPVVLAAGLFDKIAGIKDMGNQANAVDKRVEFEQSVSDAGNALIDTYNMLAVYENNLLSFEKAPGEPKLMNSSNSAIDINKYKYAYKYKKDNLGGNALTLEELKETKSRNFPNYMNGIRYQYEELAKCLLSLSAINDYIPALRNSLVLKPVNLSYSSDKNYDFKGNMESAYEKLTAPAGASEEDKHIKELYNRISSAGTLEKNISSLNNAIANFFSSSSTFSPENIQTVEALTEMAPMFVLNDTTSKDTAFSKTVKQFMSNYKKLKEDEDDHRDDPEYAVDGKYNTLAEKITAAENVIIKEVPGMYEESRFNMAVDQLNAICSAMNKQRKLIDELCGSNGLQGAWNAINTARTNAKNYKDAINGIETENQKNNFMSQYEDTAKMFEGIEQKDINAMITALQKQKAAFENALNCAKSVKFNGKNVISSTLLSTLTESYKSPNSFKDYISSVSSASPLPSLSDLGIRLKSTLEGTTEVGYTPYVSTNVPYSSWSEFYPEATANGSNPFYKKLLELCHPKENQNTSNGEALKNEVTQKVNTDTNGNPTGKDDSGNTSTVASAVNSKPWGTPPYNPSDVSVFSANVTGGDPLDTSCLKGGSDDEMASGAQKLLRSFQNYIKDLGKNLGESVLISTYLTNNFSCYTTSMDGKGTRKNDTAMLTGYAYYDQKAKTPNVCWYGAEQEYILYGLDSPEANVAAATGVIFAIRFVLNLIYSFTDPEITAFTTSVATAAGAIFPPAIPIIKTVLHIGLAMAESAYDLVQLKKGAEVPLYKSATTWMCKGTSIVKNLAADAIEKVGNEIIDTAQSKIESALDDASTSVDDKIAELDKEFENMVKEEADALKSQVKCDLIMPLESVIQQHVINYLPDKTTQEMLTEKLTTDLTAAINNLESRLGLAGEISGDNLLKTAEKKVLGILRSNVSSYANNVAENIADYVSDATGISKDEIENASANDFLGQFSQRLENLFGSAIDDGAQWVKDMKDKLREKLQGVKNDLVSQLKNGVKVTGDKARSALYDLSGSIRGRAPTLGSGNNISTGGTKPTGVSNMLGMSYQDYLTIFMMISVATGDANQLQRASQLMTINIRKSTGNKSYDLNKTVTVYKATGTATVKTVFYGSLFEDGKFKLNDKPSKYSFRHTAYMGY